MLKIAVIAMLVGCMFGVAGTVLTIDKIKSDEARGSRFEIVTGNSGDFSGPTILVGSPDMKRFLPPGNKLSVASASGPCWALVPGYGFIINSNDDGHCGFIRSSAMVP